MGRPLTSFLRRRDVLALGVAGYGTLLLPPSVHAAAPATGFTHAVASGEPKPHSVMLWTRYVPPRGDTVTLTAEMSETADFARIRGRCAVETGIWRDFTAKPVIGGLDPGRWYFYRFVAPNGDISVTGRTRTLPAARTDRFTIAILSCAQMKDGYFTAYRDAANDPSIDLALHLGDYIYEYGEAPATMADGPRLPFQLPDHELLALADYRLRYASYRCDPDLQALHLRMPMIASWDDHEISNDSWAGGAQNHDPATEGAWDTRKNAAIQAYREWMPVSEEPWSTYQIGDLATLYRTETRLTGRTRQPDFVAQLGGPDPRSVLVEFRDTVWRDPAGSMMGSEQEQWLADAMRLSANRGTLWQLVGVGAVMAQVTMPRSATGWLTGPHDRATGYVTNGILAAELGLPFNYDNWGGYPAARDRFLAACATLDTSTIVLSGDSHNSWAFDHLHAGRPVAVEFGVTSVTSSGIEKAFACDPQTIGRSMIEDNASLRWCDMGQRGYMVLGLTRDAAHNEFRFLPVGRRTATTRADHRITVMRQTNRIRS